MEQPFYTGRHSEKFGIDVLVLQDAEREIFHYIIYSELCRGEFSERSRRDYLKVINSLSARGAQAVVLGCTEIALLV